MVDFAAARKAMVESQVHAGGVLDRRILAAMSAVPRERFVPAARASLAYIDEAQTLKPGRLLAAPAPFARLIQLADISERDTVLDVGAATGYSTAVLAALASAVTGVEEDADLLTQAQRTIADLRIDNAEVVADADLGDSTFDVIVVEDAVAQVPQPLLKRLRPGGRLVATVARDLLGIATVYTATAFGFTTDTHFSAPLPPRYGATAPDLFVF